MNKSSTIFWNNDSSSRALGLLDAIFGRPEEKKIVYPEGEIFDIPRALRNVLAAFFNASENSLSGKKQSPDPDWVDFANDLYRLSYGKPLSQHLETAFFELYFRAGDSPIAPLFRTMCCWMRDLQHLLSIAGTWMTTSDSDAVPPERLFPAVPQSWQHPGSFPFDGTGDFGGLTEEEFSALAVSRDLYAKSQVFRSERGMLREIQLDDVEKPENFFGFSDVRTSFSSYFADFAAGKTVVPLFISGLPGLGKTQLTLANVLAHPQLRLILPEASELSTGLEALIQRFAKRKDWKFVLFFDDIDTREIDWYFFRTLVGGSFRLPDHITVVIASNYEFPANILSRGRAIGFPVFDELQCQWMVEDYLKSIGLRQPRSALISTIAADYTEEFSQKKYTELSPRSLVRYLKGYAKDPHKRRKILELSSQELIFKPDSQLFYEFNIRLLRALYGEEYIEKMLQEKLRNLSGV